MNFVLKINIIQRVILWPDKFLTKVVIWGIKFYQKTVSPDHGVISKDQPLVGCKFYPSCSSYGIQTFEAHGFFMGLPRVVWRILRCHPWSRGGIDQPK